MAGEVLAAYLEGEAALFKVLGTAFASSPDILWIVSLVKGGLFDETPIEGDDLAVEAALRNVRAIDPESLDEAELAAEHLRLFVGLPAPLAPVWESGYFNDKGLTFQGQMMDVRARYRALGFESAQKNREPDDSVQLELEFVARVAEEAASALRIGNDERAQELLEAHRAFLSDHLLCWVGVWADLVSEHGREPLYPALAQLMAALVSAVAARFNCVPSACPLRAA